MTNNRPAFTVEEERSLMTEDFCFICSRFTDHFGEHSDAQILSALERYDEAAALSAKCYSGTGHTLHDNGYTCADCGEYMGH